MDRFQTGMNAWNRREKAITIKCFPALQQIPSVFNGFECEMNKPHTDMKRSGLRSRDVD